MMINQLGRSLFVMRFVRSVLLALSLMFISVPTQAAVLVLNEFLPDGDIDHDANHDGTIDATEDEFVEFVNVEGDPFDLSGWSLWNSNFSTHVFEAGTVLCSGCPIVVFGGGAPDVGAFPSNALIQTASGIFGLSLNDFSDSIILKDTAGTERFRVDYVTDVGDTSLTLSPDLNAAQGYVGHDTLSSELVSPGRRSDGPPFDRRNWPIDLSQHTATVHGEVVLFNGLGRVLGVDPRQLDSGTQRACASVTDIVAVHSNAHDDSMLAVTSDGLIYQGVSTNNWIDWTLVGSLPGGAQVVDLTQHTAATFGDFVFFSSDGRVWEVDPRHLDDGVVRTSTAPFDIVAVHSNTDDDSILSVSSDGAIYKGTALDDWMTWTLAGTLPGGSDLVDFSQHTLLADGEFVFFSRDGRVWQADPHHLGSGILTTSDGPYGVVAVHSNSYDHSMLAVTVGGVLHQAVADDQWADWPVVGTLPSTAEVCDAVDNNCNGKTDFVGCGVALVRFTDSTTIAWEPQENSVSYDVVRGDLMILRSSAGDFSIATALCLASEESAEFVFDANEPTAGEGYWYLVRGRTEPVWGTCVMRQRFQRGAFLLQLIQPLRVRLQVLPFSSGAYHGRSQADPTPETVVEAHQVGRPSRHLVGQRRLVVCPGPGNRPAAAPSTA